MKSSLYLALLCITITTSLSAKARLGEYFLGFGYSMADGSGGTDNREGDFLRITASSPNDANSDLSIYLDYGTMNFGGQDASSWNLGADYLAHFQGVGGRSLRLRPSLGAGVGFIDDERPIKLGDDGFTWSLLLGTELQFTNSLSLHLGGRFLGLWSEFGENEFTVDTGITWWFDAIHGVSLEYQRAFEAELHYFTLKYLYSWQ